MNNTKRSRNNRFSNNRTTSRNTRGRKKGVSALNPASLVKRATPSEQKTFTASRSFEEMNLRTELKANLKARGFTHPTQIQEKTFEALLAGRDLMGIANTGTGKTGAFLMPVIQRLLTGGPTFTTLVVVPTRELALQVETEFKSLSRGMRLYSSSFIGGTNVGRDLSQLRRENHLIIGTPGRLMDLANRGALKFQDISVLILDEFDRMLDMGFVHEIKRMVSAMSRREQTMLFSATIDKTQESLIASLLTNPVEVKVNSGVTTNDQIDQDIIRVPEGGDKFAMLRELMDDREFEKVLVFAETKRMVDKVNKKLHQSGIKTDLIHGNKSQNYRNKALDKFKKGHLQVLVATDVAARGIDVTDVTHVINFQLPMSFDSYVHRIGRTGRAGKTGKALTFVD